MKLSVEVYIKKNTLVANGEITTDNTAPFDVLYTNLTMTSEQYVGHYVKITSGDYKNSVSWILHNDTANITLQNPIPTKYRDKFEIYRSDYHRLDLFKDEKISITSQIGNANDIGKLYTDYTQSFTIPASKNNNQILSHWYESSIDNGFDHRMRYDAYIEVNTHRFKNGTIQLEKADKKNGFIESYSVTFYGNIVQLKDIIKDDKLQTLDYSEYNHSYNSSQIFNRISTSTYYTIKYPIIGSLFKYTFFSGGPTDITTTGGAIKWDSLFPAIEVSNIFYQIQRKYGIIFTGSFFNLDQWTKLYLYLKQGTSMIYFSQAEKINFAFVTTGSGYNPFPEINLNDDILTTNWNFGNTIGNTQYYTVRIAIQPNSASMTIPYILYVYKDGVLFTTLENVGFKSMIIDTVKRSEDPTLNHTYTFKLSVQSISFNYVARLLYKRFTYNFNTNFWNQIFSQAESNSTTPSAFINIANYIPDIKIVDFITGIIKAFNLMIIPRENNTYEFIPLEMYYNAGKILDITEYTYENEMTISKPKLYKSINFKYQESSNILNQRYKTAFGQNYGDLIYNSERITDNSTYEINLPFENVMFEDVSQTELFETATLIDKDLNPYIPKPMLIYCNGLGAPLTGANKIYITQNSGSPIQMSNYQRFSNEYDSLPTDSEHSHLMTMNFGNEQSPWYKILAPQGLYYRHYKNYIDNLYNIKTRLIKVKALLPPSLLGSTVTNGAGIPLGIALNDRLVIRNKRYIINSFTTDLTTGETDLELLTDYRGVNAASTVGYRFASMETVLTDREALTFNQVIYLNDYDSFNVKNPVDFLVYTASSNNKNDIKLSVTIPYNSTGLDRSDVIILEYKIAGATVKTENIIVTQTA